MLLKRRITESQKIKCDQCEVRQLRVDDEIEYLGRRLRLVEVKPGVFALAATLKDKED